MPREAVARAICGRQDRPVDGMLRGGAPKRRFEAIAVMAGECLPVQLAARVLRTPKSGYNRWDKHTAWRLL